MAHSDRSEEDTLPNARTPKVPAVAPSQTHQLYTEARAFFPIILFRIPAYHALSPTRNQIPHRRQHTQPPHLTTLDHTLRLRQPLPLLPLLALLLQQRLPFRLQRPPLLELRLRRLVLLITGLELAQPGVALLLRLFLLLQRVEFLALLAVLGPVHAAGGHGGDGEALRVDAAAEHAVRRVVVARLHRARGAQQRPARQQAAQRDQRLLAQPPRQLLHAVFRVEVPAG